jgi:beta-lactamase regulating signal transducer with metallopeptidase domain
MNFFSLSLTQAWQLVGWTMILFLAAGTVVLVIGGMLRVILKRANPSVRYAASLATFALLALTPIAIAISISASLPRQRGELPTTNRTNELFSREAERAPTRSVGRGDERLTAIATTAQNEPSTPDRDGRAMLAVSVAYLPWLWIVGTPLTFLLLATGLIGAERLRSSCDTLTDGPIRTACDELQRSLRIGRQVGVAVCERIASPLLVGVVKPLILLPPAALNGWTTAELEMVLVHELAHVRRWDNAVNLAQRIVESLLFFHPAVWIVSGWVRRDREDCCDAAVVRHTAKPQAYAELLVALASHAPGLATSVAMAQHPLASRIRRILKLEDEPMLVTRKGLFVGIGAVVVAALLVFALPTTGAEEASPASRQRQRPEVNAKTAKDAEKTPTPAYGLKIGEDYIPFNRKLFVVGDSNPLVNKEYFVSEESMPELLKIFKAYTQDPKGPQVDFHFKWLRDVSRVEVTAPDKAHKEFFRQVFGSIRKQAKDSFAARDSNQDLNAKTAKEAEKNPLFPSLEDQRAADLAYKLLGVELEKLTPEELERVKAKEYQGGLRVTSNMRTDGTAGPMQAGDILVGLHVWPTESLTQVQEILTRLDMNDLSPLKFYVIRQRISGGYGEGMDAMGNPTAPDPQLDELITGRIVVDLQAWAEKEGFKQERLKQSQATTSTSSQLGDNPFGGEADLLYDGKTFDEWRNLWKTELKTEKRIECIKALAAFGRAGKGKEAAEAILDVAAEYDFGKGEGGSATDLKSAISQVLTDYESIDGQYWLPLLVERLKTDPERWSSFAEWVLKDAQGKNLTPYLKQLATDNTLSAEARGAALAGLAGQPDIAEAVAMVRQALTGDQPVMQIFNRLRFHRLDLFPEQFELLFHDNKQIRDQVFGIARSGGTDGEVVLNKLIEALSDPARKEDREQVIVALYKLNGYYINLPERRQPVVDKVTEILVSGDTELLPASLVLMSSLTGNDERLVIRVLGDMITDERRQQLENAIEQAEELKAEQNRGMGGGGLGGGGMF